MDRVTIADDAIHPLELYRWAVQDPETHAAVLAIMHQRGGSGREAAVFREDFAGSCADSVAWLAMRRAGGPARRAVAVDLDGAALAWGRARAARLLGSLASGLETRAMDVMDAGPPGVPEADVIAALNFSVLYLHEREALVAYLANARRGLGPGGVLVMNLFGGPATVRVGTERHRVTPTPRLSTERAIPAFDYLWEVRSFDAGRRVVDCRIHFEVAAETPAAGHVATGADARNAGGVRRIDDAFRYDFKVWTPAELLDACREAGFASPEFWRHTYDPSKGAAGVFLGATEPRSVDGLESWTAYVVARA
ncbi:MAG: class I SAM-dependent methyltransferase [Phycisphaerales bacterium]